MQTVLSFGEVLEAVDKLPLEDQESLIDILHRRLMEQRRAELARDIQDARREFREGGSHPVTPDEIMKEIMS